VYAAESSASERHLRARFLLDDGREVWFTDPRRFGEAFLLERDALDERFQGRVGIEPLSEEFTPQALAAMSAGRTAPLKSFLLDQSGVAGVGNIYADEALFHARLHPLSPAGSMREEHHRALRDGIVAALEAGLAEGGASVDDYRDSRGEMGTMQNEFLVHTREGEPCFVCERPIQRIVVAGRSTYYCANCQVRLRRRRRPRDRPLERPRGGNRLHGRDPATRLPLRSGREGRWAGDAGDGGDRPALRRPRRLRGAADRRQRVRAGGGRRRDPLAGGAWARPSHSGWRRADRARRGPL
jgi:formamidopyrimidine-DNA glycosylase